MNLESILLGVLAKHPSTGYDLKNYLDTRGRFLRSNTQMSQVYRSLRTMESRGWVECTVEPRAGATDAKVYHVTEGGMEVFLERLTGPYDPPSRARDPDFDTRLAFAGFMTREQLLRIIDVELEARREQIKRYRHRDRRLPLDPVDGFDDALQGFMDEWMHRYGAMTMDTHLASLDRLREALVLAPEDASTTELLAQLPAV